MVASNRRDRRTKVKIGRRQLVVAKKTVNRMRIMGRLSTFENGNGPTRVIMKRVVVRLTLGY